MLDIMIEHWPFFAVALILATFGQVSKKVFFSDKMVARYQWAALGRATMALHPVIVGAFLGYTDIPASPFVQTLQGRILYFAFAGVLSTWAYSAIKAIAKSRDITLELPGESVRPPAKD